MPSKLLLLHKTLTALTFSTDCNFQIVTVCFVYFVTMKTFVSSVCNLCIMISVVPGRQDLMSRTKTNTFLSNVTGYFFSKQLSYNDNSCKEDNYMPTISLYIKSL